VAPFELKEASDEPSEPASELFVESVVEFVPAFDGQRWYKRQFNVYESNPVELQRQRQEDMAEAAILEASMRDATNNVLDGLDSEDSDSDQEANSFLYQ